MSQKLIQTRKTIAEFTDGLPYGKKSQMYGRTYCSKPAVYAIICKKTKRRYIGSSKDPHLRRSVHLYYLQNYWKYLNSNVFFGNLRIAEDVTNYGVDSFYIEILQSMPDCTREELLAAEQYWIDKCPADKLYNLQHKKTGHSLLSQIFPELHELEKEHFNNKIIFDCLKEKLKNKSYADVYEMRKLRNAKRDFDVKFKLKKAELKKYTKKCSNFSKLATYAWY